jgi:hypothetical protein
VSKTATLVLAFASLLVFSIPMSAQFGGLLPNGNVYAGVSYGQLTDVINKQSYKGWNGSFEDMLFSRFPRVGIVLDGSGFYRKGVTQYNALGGLRYSVNMGRWRPFVDAMAGIRHLTSNDVTYNPIELDFGGGVDYRLGFKSFSWRAQGDYMHTHYASFSQNDYRASTGIVWRF